MTYAIPSALLQEAQDLLSISTIDSELKSHISEQLRSGKMKPAIFQQLITLLREEDRLDKDMQKYSNDVLSFDPNQYLDHVQSIVNQEVKNYLGNKIESGKLSR